MGKPIAVKGQNFVYQKPADMTEKITILQNSLKQLHGEKEMFFQFLNDDLDMALPSFRVMDFEDARAAIIAILDSGDNDRKIVLKQKEKALVQVETMLHAHSAIMKVLQEFGE